MANELNPDEMQDDWRSQPADPVRIPADELRRRSVLCEGNKRRAFWAGASLSVFSAALCAWFFYRLPDTVPRIGFALTFIGEVVFLYQWLKLRRGAEEQAGPTAVAYRAQLVRQRERVLSIRKMFLLPFVPGPAVILLGFLIPQLGVVPAVALTSAFLAWPSAVVIPLARRRARRIEREIAELDAQLS
jgi:hypothetical protein